MRALLISGGSREHAIADALSRSANPPQIIAISAHKNPGIRSLCDEYFTCNILDFPAVVSLAQRVKPDFCFIGSDDPIGLGLTDALESIDIPCVAPTKSLARIESSKGFARSLLQKYHINASPLFSVFDASQLSDKTALSHALHVYMSDELHGEYVVKYDGLKGGKGVKLSGDHLASVEEGVTYALACIEQCGQVVIEEKLAGVEFSFLSFVSGSRVVDMPAVQDHKRAYEHDTGPNTGGMGTYSCETHSLPFLASSDIKLASTINRQVAQALLKECNYPFRGILYGGFIAVKDGVRVIEYNARFGDPEALNILPLLTSDFSHICQAITQGTLTDALVSFAHKATVCKYITPKSYPDGKTERGEPVRFPHKIPDNARIFYGDVIEEGDGFHLGSSRSAGIVGIGDTVEEAESVAQMLCEGVRGSVRYRKDIGTRALINKRIEQMDFLRKS